MNWNTGYFAAYNYRHKQPTIDDHSSLHSQHTSFSKNLRSSIESINGSESFLPSITTGNGNNDGHRPYRRNDFANNHLFIAKQKLARIFLNQSTMNIQSKNDLIHLFDQHKPKQKSPRINKNKRQDNNSDSKSISPLGQDVHLSIVNLVMKPSLPSIQTRDPLSTISHRRAKSRNFQTKTPRSSIEWTNPAIKRDIQSPLNHTPEDDLESNIIINELINKNPDILNSTTNRLDSSLLYVKSIINSPGLENC